jgi:hypothetical protein
MKAARETRTDKTSIYFNAVKASSSVNGVTSDTAQAVRGGIGYSRDLAKKLFVNGFNDYEYDRFQNLDLRFVVGGGLGYHVWKREKSNLDVLGGFDYNRSKFDPSPMPRYTTNASEFFVGDDYSSKFFARSSLTQTFRYFTNLSDSNAYRANFDLGLNTQLYKWLTWNAAFSDRFLNAPAPGRKRNDLLYTVGIGITFAH